MVVLQVQVRNFAVLNLKGDAPIAGNGDAPRPRTVPDKLVNPPSGRPAYFIDIGGMDQSAQDVPDPSYLIRPHTPGIIAFDKGLQPFMFRITNFHPRQMYGKTVHTSSTPWLPVQPLLPGASRRTPHAVAGSEPRASRHAGFAIPHGLAVPDPGEAERQRGRIAGTIAERLIAMLGQSGYDGNS